MERFEILVCSSPLSGALWGLSEAFRGSITLSYALWGVLRLEYALLSFLCSVARFQPLLRSRTLCRTF